MTPSTMTSTKSMSTTTNMINGIDVDALRETIEAVKADPTKGHTQWKVASRWAGGTRSDHAVDGVTIGGQKVDRKFTLQIDEPCELCGSNQFANPQEYLLAAMNACMMVGYAAVASVMGVTLTKLEFETTGDIDLRGFLGVDESIAKGYEQLHTTIRIAGDGTAEQFEKMHEVVNRTSPNYYNITNPVAVDTTLIVD